MNVKKNIAKEPEFTQLSFPKEITVENVKIAHESNWQWCNRKEMIIPIISIRAAIVAI